MSGYTIKDLPSEEKPRERMLKYGSAALSDTELVAIILRTGTAGNSVLEVARSLLTQYNGLENLIEADIEQLCKVKGIGVAKAVQVKAALELAKRGKGKVAERNKRPITCPDDVYEAVQQYVTKRQEHFVVLLLTTKNTIISSEEISKGGINIASVFPREVFNKAIVKNAARIILSHNHPSGDPTPSPEDIAITKRLAKAGEELGIKVLDHVIVGRDGYVSLTDRGLF
ncbi:DNA repair protein RadC [Proteinivorax hydrogeniformans]|uniref:DNA repair protein RadC n=1 Tax=Proteinivorax hydrogeniformans TaxID=1826727 RepID=A0AAU8HWH8_9FIRM